MTPPIEEMVRLRPEVAGTLAPDGSYHLLSWPHSTCLGRLTADQHALLRRLGQESVPLGELRTHPGFRTQLELLRTGGWLHVTVAAAGRKVYTVEPERPQERHQGEPTGRLILSRFAIARRDGGEVVVESPLSWCRVRLHERRALALLAADRPVDDDPALVRLRQDLWAAGLAVPEDDEAAGPPERLWQPHELWFHHRSRTRLPGVPYGKGDWTAGVSDPPGARREPFGGEIVELARSDPGRRYAAEPRLTEVLEERRSIRGHDDGAPLTAAGLGEFLHRCAGNRGIYRIDGVQHVSRPYPAGGAMHELEIYPVVRKVSGLEPGMYHYDPQDHRLERLSGTTPPVRRLLRAGAMAAATVQEPQVLLVIAARFGRVMSGYQAMAYSLVMKHVGVLYQTMYLVATAMGLAPCALGDGDGGAFAAATGLDPLEEGAVGEFALGSRDAEVRS
ncbi:SagB family peptide dehydrogenase [Nonomuraea sp. NPDC049421]|uniref:SagB/ThcOx family dehydrogenase n=1 Tax=Nonomuraea sp. NPDC049421 TaxID=3155275 RepID=UPI003435DA99